MKKTTIVKVGHAGKNEDVCRHCMHVEPSGVTDLADGFLTREVEPGIFMLTNGNYQSVFLCFLVLSAIAALVSLAIRPHRR